VVGGFSFAVVCKTSGEAASVVLGVHALKEAVQRMKRKSIPLLVVPYMGDTGKRLCEEAAVGWLDLSGNAHLMDVLTAGPGSRNLLTSCSAPPVSNYRFDNRASSMRTL